MRLFSNKEFYLTWLLLGSGALTCFGLTYYLSTPTPVSSALATLIFWPMERKFKPFYLPIIFCGSFIGMGSNLVVVLIAPIFAAIITNLLKSHFNGLGGKLGAIAFISSAFSLLVIEGVLWIS